MPKFIFARGLQKGGEVAFRPEFSEVGELRALVPSLSVMTLTASASSKVKHLHVVLKDIK